MPEQGQSLNNGGNQQAPVPSSTTASSAIDVEALAEKVYRLMCEQARLERVRSERPGRGHWTGR